MAVIKFNGIEPLNFFNLNKIFNLIMKGMADNKIDETTIITLLGKKYDNKFWWPTLEEKNAWLEDWQSTPLELRSTKLSLKTSWDFESWLEAFINAEIKLESIKLNQNGEGLIIFEQLSCPSGGIEATEELIKIFGGKITLNDSI